MPTSWSRHSPHRRFSALRRRWPRSLELARQRQFAGLLRDISDPAADRGVGLLMQAVARFALGDTPATLRSRSGVR